MGAHPQGRAPRVKRANFLPVLAIASSAGLEITNSSGRRRAFLSKLRLLVLGCISLRVQGQGHRKLFQLRKASPGQAASSKLSSGRAALNTLLQLLLGTCTQERRPPKRPKHQGAPPGFLASDFHSAAQSNTRNTIVTQTLDLRCRPQVRAQPMRFPRKMLGQLNRV